MKYRRSFGGYVFDVCSSLFLLAVVVVMVYPFLYILNFSLSSTTGLIGDLMLWPKGFNLDSYKALFKEQDIIGAFFVSVARSAIAPVLMLMVTGMAGYVMTTDNLVFGRFIRLYMIVSMYTSGGVIASFIFMGKYHLTNNFLVYVLPGMFSAYNMILIRNYINSIPYSLRESVYVDGGNDLQAYWRIIFPICKPVNAALLLMGIVGQWNSMMDTQLYCAMERKLYTLQYVLYNLLSTASNSSIEAVQNNVNLIGQTANRMTPQSMKMAITVIVIVPVMFVYPFLQKYFTSGIMIGSVKE